MDIDQYEEMIASGAEETEIEETDLDKEFADTGDEDSDSDSEDNVESDESADNDEVIEEPVNPEPAKKIQSDEENAKFAEQRRQAQVQKEVERLRNEDPAFKLAKELSEMYGTPVDQLLANLQESKLAKEAEQRQVPVEQLRRENEERARQTQQNVQLQDTVNQLMFQNWTSRMDTETAQAKTEYPMLNDQDLLDARMYLLEVAGNPNLPLEHGIQALHGKRIIQSLKETAKTEALAELSGRKKGPLPPAGTKSTKGAVTLTAEEARAAKAFGMSEDEFIKWRS